MRHYLARLSFNGSDWRHPTREAQAQEEKGTYNQEYGFGHEDWLFRSDWLIAGWRYGFIQGVNSTHDSLVAAKEPFDLTLFSIDDRKRRRYIAKILAAECLDDLQAEAALDEFKRRGWYQKMLDDIREVSGDSSALGNTQWAKHVLNVRFRLENVCWFEPQTFAKSGDPIFTLNRYTLTDLDKFEGKQLKKRGQRHGVETPPAILTHLRRVSKTIECTPEHARMQAQLMSELHEEFPNARIVREEAYVDVSVTIDSEIILFEIKSDQEPKSVIRQALGQILEYAYHPTRNHEFPVRLVIVGRNPLLDDDKAYLELLKTRFLLPIEYRVTELSRNAKDDPGARNRRMDICSCLKSCLDATSMEACRTATRKNAVLEGLARKEKGVQE